MKKVLKTIFSPLSVVSKFRFRLILLIAVTWVFFDTIYILIRFKWLHIYSRYYFFEYNEPWAIILREIIIFFMSALMGYVLVFNFKRNIRDFPLWLNFILKTVLLLALCFLMNFLVHFAYSIVISNLSPALAWSDFVSDAFTTYWILEKIPSWFLIFFVTQLIIEITEKYSPGIFLDIFFGKYVHPRVEKRIVMFIDLKDSTPIAEKLGHSDYFRFIRDFIYFISTALIEYGGRIYQYVGDEIVVSWPYTQRNTKRCMASLIEARKLLQRNSERFRRRFGVAPEFRVGIHAGEVTVGEIGVIKKDLAMSGDTMNTTARIRSACSELNQKFIVSKDFMEAIDLEKWQAESLGVIDLKGKANGVELFALKI
ncbi:MAG TPA: adenylate/guanylate cyclase domain-containing protein [Chitinophagaceae bacterium]|nr:adenylate/guanylate cyclase domain-containing protein [Chitinophagaceae bacterium]